MNTDKATPRPWHNGNFPHNCRSIFSEEGRMRLEDGGTTLYPIAWTVDFNGESEANAALIVRAVNNYDDMIEALKMALSALLNYPSEHGEVKDFLCQIIKKA